MVTVEFKAKNKIYLTTLRDVKHTPEVPNNLISIGGLTDNGHLALFTATGVQFKSGTGVIFGEGQKVGRMYQMSNEDMDKNLRLNQRLCGDG